MTPPPPSLSIVDKSSLNFIKFGAYNRKHTISVGRFAKMDLGEILGISQNFILRNLYGTLGTLEPIKADFDSKEEVWTVEFTYQNWRKSKPMKVVLILDDEDGEILSFNTEEA